MKVTNSSTERRTASEYQSGSIFRGCSVESGAVVPMAPSKLNYRVSVLTFFAKAHPNDECCGTNGLPLTPNSIGIFGRAQLLKSDALRHEHLCTYLDAIRGKHERTIIVQEYVGCPLAETFIGENNKQETLLRIGYQVLAALAHLNRCGLVCRNLDPTSVLVSRDFGVKLYNYGLYHMTGGGRYVSFPIGNVRYQAPEVLLGSRANAKSDVWSLGIVLAELALGCTLWESLKLSQIVRKVLSLVNTQHAVFEKLAREHNRLEVYEAMDAGLRRIIEECLTISPRRRPLAKEALEDPVFDFVRLSSSSSSSPASASDAIGGGQTLVEKHLSLSQIYYLWQLAGGDVQQELKKEGLIKSEAPILSLPNLVMLNGRSISPPKSQSVLHDHRIIFLNFGTLLERLSGIPEEDYLPLIYSTDAYLESANFKTVLPLVIRERDMLYQFHRLVLLNTLLHGYPYTHDLLRSFAAKDIPPLCRGQVWACLLGVVPNGAYERLDKCSPTHTDRQIEVDIPRCHQYNELLSAPEGHAKLKRLLKAWVAAHPQYVYWQGLDSLTAPFLYLNFNDEERAFLSLYRFIPKYLHLFFLKDNSAIIKEYLVKFFQLIFFHEPALANHLHGISFIPELYAIPWFLTMFSHVFPLHKIFHLWDKLILGDNSYPLFIGIAILRQLKGTLLKSGFNECILLFSDLPDIVIESCVNDSETMYQFTPKSITYRKFALHEEGPEEFDLNYTEEDLREVQAELHPRISVYDLIRLLRDRPASTAILDIRSSPDYRKVAIENSINVPFASVSLKEPRLEALNVPRLEAYLRRHPLITVIVSVSHESAMLFAKFLVDSGVPYVAVLHRGFEAIYRPDDKLILQTFDYINTLAKHLTPIGSFAASE
ncbi:TBC domain-containing protein kinase-like protein isoform X2 [Anopheles gambiae]|uniref:TBC domain-containing protein kinase-like protein isoform X2 n=1 Tax=Anopheles gambiae TaxID=7165 RepID=UPI002AC9DFA0|nr:TBC domain-containing protein kinase-like protein isoform X2 [Anopheles gambiae]XP_061509229.1 TBC domain-containing protein kinase-like protein isoform X2 [Anopheles gambiae]XP_310531.6 TBC domain-containing protein kinase-like protein isoform X2 [Anopheles gambiae]